MSGLYQVISAALFNLRSLPERKGSAITAAIGIAGVVGVLVGVLAIAEGFRKAMTVSASPEVAVVLRSGADSEMTSGLEREATRVISDAPGIARGANGPLTSAELFVIINLPNRKTGTDANVPLRGVQPGAFEVRGNVEIVEGRRFETGKNEIIVGAGAARSFIGLEVGKEIKMGQVTWTVVGIFTAEGGIAESEIWSDADVLAPAYNRSEGFQSVYVRLTDKDVFEDFKDTLTADPKLSVKVSRQSDFYEEQATIMTDFITKIGVSIAVLMALGALFGALNTMYSAVAARTREISTLRALGFGTGPVVISVLVESVMLSLLGGAIGAIAAYLLFDGYKASTMNFQTFSQVSFAFSVTPRLLLNAILFATAIGLFGGIFPAIRSARLPIASGLRES
ncbi:ABC transporter permease [Luteolibacter sp. GHJ8]|uniref:ABC transporter permease n=1 Tax=Luteolibacter rhizosphaerae TaxID=2989719 RepID=A0ABT3G5P6_9BACT|nr:ABC transporter permease [Luteolibacter rhizosphaerae]MCW1915186.1 ABC transporter permease [Luteolibacter rhizosphaerae]